MSEWQVIPGTCQMQPIGLMAAFLCMFSNGLYWHSDVFKARKCFAHRILSSTESLTWDIHFCIIFPNHSEQWSPTWSHSPGCSPGDAVGELCWLGNHPPSQCMGVPHFGNHAVQQTGLQFSFFVLKMSKLWLLASKSDESCCLLFFMQQSVFYDISRDPCSPLIFLGYRAGQGGC